MTGVAPDEALGGSFRRVLAPNPSPMTGRGTNTYLVGSHGAVVVDPGPDDAAHLARVLDAAGAPIRYVLVTHAHLDHASGARPLAELAGALLLGPAGDGPGGADAPGYEPDAVLSGGDVVAVPGWRLTAVDTPGHAAHHLCYLLDRAGGTGAFGSAPSRRVLFSGDLVLGGSSSVVAAPGGDMAAYLASLELVRALDPPVEVVAPGHGELVFEVQATLDAYLARRTEREQEVVAALERCPGATAAGLASVVYPELAPGLEDAARLQVWAHLRKLSDEGRASSTDPEDPGAPWSPA